MSEELHTLRMNNERSESAVRLREIDIRIDNRIAIFKKQMEYWNMAVEASRFVADNARNSAVAGEHIMQTVEHVDLLEKTADTEEDGEAFENLHVINIENDVNNSNKK